MNAYTDTGPTFMKICVFASRLKPYDIIIVDNQFVVVYSVTSDKVAHITYVDHESREHKEMHRAALAMVDAFRPV